MKFLDLLDEKIDYLFKRGKNADERCYDFFIRTITFLLVALIVLCYGSFVHAATQTDTNDYDLMNQDYFFTYSELNQHYAGSSASNVYSEINQGFLSTFPPLWSENRIVNFESQISGISLNNDSSIITDEYKKYYALFLQLDTGTNNGICRCNLISIYAKDIPLIINNGSTVFNSSLQYWYVFSEYPYVINKVDFQVNYSNQNLPFQLKGNSSTEVSVGGLHVINGDVTAYLFGCDCNIYSLMYSNIYSDTTSNSKLYTTVQDMINAIYDDNVTEKPFNLNPKADVINPVIPEDPEVESDSNNLYLDELQVGLTSNVNGQDLLSSEVLIGVSTENNWIINHIDNYDLNIIFRFNIKDTFPSSPNDPSVACEFSAPLRTFLDEPYQKSIIDIMKSSLFESGSTYSNFYQYYTSLVNANNYKVVSTGTFKGIIPLITETMYEGLFGNYTVVPPENPNYTIFNFNMEVICWLTSDQSEDESGNYSKSFDFLNGVSSINSAGIFKNNNPWEGEQIPSANPLIPSGNGSVSGGYGGGNVNVTVNNDGNHKIPLNVHTKKELNDTINNYGEITDTFFDTYKELTDETKEDGYISLLRQTLPEVSENVPIIDFMLKCAICVIALGVIIFVLKVLLF